MIPGSFATYTSTKTPATLGIVAGNTFDQTPIYVGYGNHSVLAIPKCPGRLSSASTKAYLLSSNSEILSTNTAAFLLNHASFYWIPANGMTAFTNPDTITWTTDTSPVTFGRKEMSGYMVVGYVSLKLKSSLSF